MASAHISKHYIRSPSCDRPTRFINRGGLFQRDANRLKYTGLIAFQYVFPLVFLVCNLHLYGQPVETILSENAPYSQFKEFLSVSRPPIALVRYSRSCFFYSLRGNQITNDVEYEASVQPNTHYIKEIGTLFEPGTNKFTVSGISYLDAWYIDQNGQVSVLSRDPNISGSNTPPEKYIADRERILEEVLSLGILLLDHETVSWSNNDFKAQTKMPNEFGTVSGHISGNDDVRPSFLEYKFSKKEMTYKVIYEYQNDGDRPNWMPNKTILNIKSPKFDAIQNSLLITNSIQKLRVGLTNAGKTGYTYSFFLSSELPLTNGSLVVYSNGIGHVLIGNHFEAIQKTTDLVTADPARRKTVRTLCFIFIAVNILIFGWYVARSHPTPSQMS